MLGLLCGLESEAAIARSVADARVACAAARPHKARALAAELIRNGATRLISFGVAGALDPDLPVGAIIVGTRVDAENGAWDCDRIWSDALADKLPGVRRGGVWGSETLIPAATAKRGIYARSRAVIVDMESQCVAEIAANAGVPFAVLRVVCDRAAADVPPLVMESIREDGSVDAKQALRSLLRRPSQIPDLIHVGCSMNKALRALRRAADALRAPL